MSDNNDINLLDDDLGDDADYDLGNEDEDALLADDYDPLDITVQTSYAAEESVNNMSQSQEYEEPLDDVLDIGGTDEDDLDSDILDGLDHSRNVEKTFTNHESVVRESKTNSDSTAPNTVSSTNVSKEDEPTNAEEHLESEEEEENEERDRFKSERTNIVSVKSSKTVGNIPDSLDHVIAQEEVPVKKKKFNARNDSWRGRRAWQGGGRGPCGNSRGGGGLSVHARYHQQASRQNFQQQKPQPQPFLPYPESSAFAARGLDVPNFPRIPPSDLPIQQPPPHKILINPHFRGAVQPHPDARLVWDTEPPINNGFSQRMMVSEQLGQGYESAVHSNHMLHEGHGHGHGQNFGHPVNQQSLQPHFYQDSYMDHSLPPDHWLGGGPPMHSQSSMNSQQGDPYYIQSREQMMFQSQQQFPPYQEQMPRYQHPGPVQEPMPMQPNVWQNNIQPGPPKMALSVVPQHYSPNQDIFRMPQPGGPNMSMAPRFRHPAGPRFSNFNQKNRPRFQGRTNGPNNVRHPAPKLQQQQQHSVVQNQPVQQAELPKPQHLQQSMTVVPVRFEANVKRKKQRMPDMSNLHEVKTVDMLPTVKVEEEQQEEPEDEETRAYRLKIEEQKRLREQLLQVKEERRKQAALEKQRLLKQQHLQEPSGPPPSNADTMESVQGIAIATIVNRNPVTPAAPVTQKLVVNSRGRGARGRGIGIGRGVGILGHAPPQQLQAVTQTAQASPIKKIAVNSVQSAPSQQGQRLVRTGAQTITQGTVVTATAATSTQPAQNTPQQVRKVVLRGASSGTGAIKRAVVPQMSQQRMVIQAPQPPAQGAVPGRVVVAGPPVVADSSAASQSRQSKAVCVDNLSADTDEMKLRQMCLRVGTVEKVQMQPEQCRAIITFTKPAAAANFINRYQRKMVDLSLISVSLV